MKKSLILCLGLLLSLSLTSCEEGSHQGFVHVDESDDTTTVEPLPDEDDSDTGGTPEGGESGESGDTGESGGTETPHTHTADTTWHYDETDSSLGHWHVCVDDGEKMDETVASHTYVDTTVEATHTSDGSITHTCECGYSYVEVIPASGHSYTDVYTEPTCTQDGYTTYTCECGESYTVTNEGSALGHLVTTWTYVDETYHKGTCTRCSEEISEEHTITSKEDESYYYTYCSVCDPNCEHPISTVDKSVEHTHTESSSWTTDGEYHWKVCTECGQTIDSTKAAHTVVEWTSSDETYHKGTCTVCAAEVTAQHTYSDGVVTAPTCGEGGYTTYTCECGYSYTGNETQATGVHTWSDWTPDSTDTSSHIHTCSVCETTEKESHTITYVTDGDSTHHPYCAVCGYTGESVAHTIVTTEDSDYTYTYCSVCNHLLSKDAKVTEVFESFTYHITINDNSGNSLGYAEGITLFVKGSYNGTWNEGGWYEWGDAQELTWNEELGTYDLVLDFIPENSSSNLSEARYFYVYYSLTDSINDASDIYKVGYYEIGTSENDPNAVGVIEKAISISTSLSSWEDLTSSSEGSDTPTDFYVVIFDYESSSKSTLYSTYTTLSGGLNDDETYNYFDGSDSTTFTSGETAAEYYNQPYVVSGKGSAEAGYKTGFWFTAYHDSWQDQLVLGGYMGTIPDTSENTVAVFCLVKSMEADHSTWEPWCATTNITGISNGWVTDVPSIETFFSTYITGWVN
ncbi:MAG: hypothetical protein LUC31_03565 [Coprobacillus sp.]|nr:hypothetical protein [Coprobacillus sp.]